MCNQAAGLSRCLTKVQDSMITQLKSLPVDKAKGKTAEKTQQAVEELDYLVTFNRSISQAMQRTMQDLSEGVFISMANLTLARRDSYLEFICGGVKPDTLPYVQHRSIFIHCFQTVYWSRLKMKSHVVRRGVLLAVHTGSLDVFTHTLPQVAYQHINRTRSPLHRPGSKLETGKWDRKVVAKPQISPKSRFRVQRKVNDNYCVLNVARVKDSVHVSGKNHDLNPPAVTSKSETVFLHVNSFVANVHSVTGLPQKKGVNPNDCNHHTEIKHVNGVSCVGHLSSANTVTNVQTVAINPPVGARLQQFWEKWEALGSSPKVVTILREGYTLSFRFRPNLTRSPTVISNYVNPQRQSHLLEALYQLTNKNAVEPVANQNSLGFYNRLFLVPKPNNRWRPILDLSSLNTFLNTESFKMEPQRQ